VTQSYRFIYSPQQEDSRKTSCCRGKTKSNRLRLLFGNTELLVGKERSQA
jgi:hypothetical protein